MHHPKKSKKQQRKLNRQTHTIQQPNLDFQTKIQPITLNQKRAFEAYDRGKHLMLYGTAGTGKSFISLYLALEEMLESDIYKKVVIVRSVVQLRDMGYLPGSQKEKTKVYEAPYYAICAELFGRGDAYELLKSKNQIEFISTSFIRGITLNDCIVVVDECQNLVNTEANSIITRVGNNCKIIFCGDLRQTDLNPRKESSGLGDFMKIIQRMNAFEFIEFMPQDIVRSRLVKEYILIRNELEDKNVIEPLSRICA